MTRRNEVVVGAVIVLGVALLVVGTLWLKGAGLGREEEVVQARFREIGQLLEGNAVKLRGVPIGEVETIALEESGEGVIVDLRIRSDVRLPQDPVVLLSPESMFGDWQAEIHPRSAFPRYVYAEALDAKVLPGYSLPDISQLTAVADRIAENLAVLTERVGIAFTEETARNVREAIENIQQVSEQLTGLVSRQQKTMDVLAADLSETTETVAQTAESVRRAFGQVEAAIGQGELRDIVSGTRRLTADLDSLSSALVTVSRELGKTLTSADSAFSSLSTIVQGVERGEGTLGMLLRDTSLYGGMVQTNAQVQALLRDFQRNPRKYINLSVF